MDWMTMSEQAFERGYVRGLQDARAEWELEKTEMQKQIACLNTSIAELRHILELVTRERI